MNIANIELFSNKIQTASNIFHLFVCKIKINYHLNLHILSYFCVKYEIGDNFAAFGGV